jgi:hypothetical protein
MRRTSLFGDLDHESGLLVASDCVRLIKLTRLTGRAPNIADTALVRPSAPSTRTRFQPL